jgi:phosphoribosylformimino-5-aminoimidazole carboxamide ribotide isomerase
MIVIPAIDLRAGSVVRLQQGDYARETRYDDSAMGRARLYHHAGAKLLHVVDLDAARDGGAGNLEAIDAICRALDLPVQTGGGVRGRGDVVARLEAGASRVVIGSLCVQQPEEVCRWIDEFGPERIVAGLDVKRDEAGRWIPQAAGWTRAGERDLHSLLEQLIGAGLEHVLCTDIARDGMLSGPGVALYRELRAGYPGLAIQASGGIGSEDDIERVAELDVAGCIVGRALLEGQVELDAIARWTGGAA